MIGGVISILIAFWYYRGAESRGLPKLQWAFAGVITYYIPNFLWSLGYAKPMINQLHTQGSGPMGSLLGFSSVLIGILVTGVVYLITLKSKPLL